MRACACVPLLGEAQNICFCTILSEISENHICILQYLHVATVALKTDLYSLPSHRTTLQGQDCQELPTQFHRYYFFVVFLVVLTIFGAAVRLR